MKSLIVLQFFVIGIMGAEAQDSVHRSPFNNTVKLDLTSHLIYRNALILSYERITRPNQSFVVTAGYQEFPRTSNFGENISVRKDGKKYGIKFGGEYRFYLKGENKYPAPRGVYIGPYFSFNGFNNERTLIVDNNGSFEQAILNSNLRIFNVGFQLGYQFVIKNRWTIDLIFAGPSLSHYGFKVDLGGTYTFDKEDIQNEIILDLIDRFPLLEEVITNKEASRNGRLNSWSFGYRYQLQVGYHFGRRK